MRTLTRSKAVAMMSAGLLITGGGIAVADNLNVDGDVLSGGNNVSLNTAADCATGKTFNGSATLNYNGNTHYNEGSTVTPGSETSAAVAAQGITVGAGAAFTVSGWDQNTDTRSFTTSVTVSSSTADGVYAITVFTTGVGTDFGGRTPTTVDPYRVTKDYTVTVACDQFDPVTPPAVNQAPTVSTAALDATGAEGSQLSTGGTFADDNFNGSTLTIAIQGNGTGTVTPSTNSGWSWSHTPTDNGSGTVVVRATDAQGLYVEDSFDWTATNANPVVGALSLTRLGACEVSLSASFTDAGSGDTHSGSIDWGDASTAEAASISQSTRTASGSHSYAAAGTYTVSLTVTDDDLGTGSNTASFKANNTASGILAPINTGGTRSSFKQGSTVPVKITVTGCDNLPVTNLTPQVSLALFDQTPDFPVNESVVSLVATNGKQMRWDGTQYIYNLSTKQSQFTNAALSGTYNIAVYDPTFAAPTQAAFDVRR